MLLSVSSGSLYGVKAQQHNINSSSRRDSLIEDNYVMIDYK